MLMLKVTLWCILMLAILSAEVACATSAVIVQIAVNNPKFALNSAETHHAILTIQRALPTAEFTELQPGRAQKFFCSQPEAVMYPVITKPDCHAELVQIDHIKMIVFYLAKDVSAVRYIGARRGYSKTTSDYAKFFPQIKQLFEVQNDQKLYDMFKLGRLDAIVMEEQSAKAFALFDNPHIVTSQFNVYAAFRGVDPRSLALDNSASIN